MLTQEQREIRQTGIGGSDAPIVCNNSSYMTAVELYFKKINPLEEEEVLEPQDLVKSPRYWGHIIEENIINSYALARGYKVERMKDTTFRSKRYPWMLCHVDGVVTEPKPIIVEAKNRNLFSKKYYGEEGTDVVTTPILLQAAHNRIVMEEFFPGLEVVEIPIYFGGSNFEIFTYTKDEELEQNLIATEDKFWNNHVLKRIPPEPVFYRDVMQLWPESKEESIVANDDITQVLDKWREVKRILKEAKKKEENYKIAIAKQLKTASVLLSPDGVEEVTFRADKNGNKSMRDCRKV